MKSSENKSRSIKVDGRLTSVSLDDDFWAALREIADEKNTPLRDLVEQINRERGPYYLSAALRRFILKYYRSNRSAPTLSDLSNGSGRGPGELVLRLDITVKPLVCGTSLAWLVDNTKPLIAKAQQLGSNVEAVAIFGRQQFPIV